MLFGKYFLIIYLIYINVYMLIPNPSIIQPVSGGQQALQVHHGGTLPATCPQLPQPQDTPALGPKLIRLQGCDTGGPRSLCPEGNRVIIPFFAFSVFISSFELEFIGKLQSCGCVVFYFFPSTKISFTSINTY